MTCFAPTFSIPLSSFFPRETEGPWVAGRMGKDRRGKYFPFLVWDGGFNSQPKGSRIDWMDPNRPKTRLHTVPLSPFLNLD